MLHGDHSQRDAEAATMEDLCDTAQDDKARHPISDPGASDPGKGTLSSSRSARMDIDACFAVIIGQVAAFAAKTAETLPRSLPPSTKQLPCDVHSQDIHLLGPSVASGSTRFSSVSPCSTRPLRPLLSTAPALAS